MKILVACEESQAVTIAFRKLGHEAYSCDILDCSGGHPEWHIKQDVLPLLNEKWDMIIAFPPCTYLSNAGAKHLYKNKELNMDRYKQGLAGKEFFMKFYNANCSKICIENPTPSKIYNLPEPTQVIHPYYFGAPYKKRTLLWLKGLPKLVPTNIIENPIPCRDKNSWYNSRGGKNRRINRSKTFPGVAEAMAIQWGKL